MVAKAKIRVKDRVDAKPAITVARAKILAKAKAAVKRLRTVAKVRMAAPPAERLKWIPFLR
jgi:hypothetical protein